MPRRPLLAAAAISAIAVLTAAALVTGGLALLGHSAPAGTASGWTGWEESAAVHRAASADRRAMTPDDASALALLARAGSAATTVGYTARTATTGGAALDPVIMQVTGMPGVGTLVRGTGADAVLAGDGGGATLADAARVLGLLRDNYRVVRESSQDRSVAGRSAESVIVLRPDGTVAAKFWVDSDSGLLLRRDLVAPGGRTTSSTRVIDLQLGTALPSHLPPLAADGWPNLLDPAGLADRRAAGCSCADTLPGGLTLLQARTDETGAADGPGSGVTHLLYSDGLSAVSVFEEPGSLGAAATGALTAQGFAPSSYAGMPVLERVLHPGASGAATATGEWVWQSGAAVLTLVGPASPHSEAHDRVTALVAALDRSGPVDPTDGPVAWVQRGWHRASTAVEQSWRRLS